MDMLEKLFQWRPSANIPPRLDWASFECENAKLGKKVGISIKTLTPDYYENAIGFLTAHFLTEEPSSRAAKIVEDEASLAIWHGLWMKSFEQGVSLVAVTDEPDSKIVGVLVICVVSEADQIKEELPAENIQRQSALFYGFDQKINKYKIYNVEYFAQDWGLCTDPDWRQCSIGTKLLQQLSEVAKHYKIEAVLFIFTSRKSQSLAVKTGFQFHAEVVYDELKDESGEVILPIPGNESAKLMGFKVEL